MDNNKDLIAELAMLHDKHPGLPVLTMVDSEVVADDDHSFWKSKIRAVKLDKYVETDSKIIVYSRSYDIEDVYDIYDQDVISRKIPNDLSQAERTRLMTEMFENAPWVDAIIVWVGV